MAEAEKADLRMATKVRDEGQKLLAERKLVEGITTLPPKQNSNLQGKPVKVKTNFFKIDLDKSITVHQYRATIVLCFPPRDNGEARELTVTDSISTDARRVEFNEMARKSFDLTQQLTPLPDRNRLYFDNNNLLFALDDLGGPMVSYEIRKDQANEEHFNAIHTRAQAIRVKLDKIEVQVRLVTPPDLNNIPADDISETRHFMQFLDIATSEHASRTGNYVVYGNGLCYLLDPGAHGYQPNDFPMLDFGTYIALGVKKTIRLIGDTPQEATPALVIDPKVTPFRNIQPVSELVLRSFPDFEQNPNGNHDTVTKLLKGCYVLPLHIQGTVPLRKIAGLNSNALTHTFTYNERDVTVFEYFQEKYRITLQHPRLPLLTSVSRGQTTHLPMELFEIADHQPVKQMAPQVQQQVLRISTRLPSVLNAEIGRNSNALHFNDSPGLANAGIAVQTQPIVTDGRELQSPLMVYRNSAQPSVYDSMRGNWRPGAHYSVSGQVGLWALYALERGGGRPVFNEQGLNQFAQCYVNECQKKGFGVQFPGDIRILRDNGQDRVGHKIGVLESIFSDAKDHQCRFIMLITTKADEGIHLVLKKYEQMFGIVTQNVTSDTAKAAAGLFNQQPKRLTMENIINKTNMKLGGLNYNVGDPQTFQYIGEDDLFIGIGTNHPEAGFGNKLSDQSSSSDIPSVVGYAANDLAFPSAYSGDYYYQEARRDEKFNIIEKIVKKCLERYIANRKKKPVRVIIFRNGCSEGQFDLVLKFEVPLVRKLVADLVGPTAKVAVVVSTKIHPARLIPLSIQGQKPTDQNLKPGTIVDKGIVHPYFNEFYLLGHLGRLGTAKVPRYTILSNQDGIPDDDIKMLTYQLAFGHQIISGTTGLPTPCYVADEYAKRGRNIFKAHTSDSHALSADSSKSLPEKANEVYTYERVPMADGTGMLRDLRFNA